MAECLSTPFTDFHLSGEEGLEAVDFQIKSEVTVGISRDISYSAEEFFERVLSNSLGVSMTVEATFAKALPILARSLPQCDYP